MIVVSNATPLSGLAQVQRFGLLQQLLGEILIPQVVYDEVVSAGRKEGGARREVSTAYRIKAATVQDRFAVSTVCDKSPN